MLSDLKAFFTKLFKKKKKKNTLTQFAENQTSSEASFWADSWMEIVSLLYWPQKDN